MTDLLYAIESVQTRQCETCDTPGCEGTHPVKPEEPYKARGVLSAVESRRECAVCGGTPGVNCYLPPHGTDDGLGYLCAPKTDSEGQ